MDVIVNAADTDFTPGGGIARWIAKARGNIFGSLAPREVALLSDRLEHGAI